MPTVPPVLEDAVGPLPDAPLCVGFSGGLDSAVLLHLLASSPEAHERGLRAMHVHHGLQERADDWAAHCRDVCAALSVPLTIHHVTVPRDSGLGIEGAARQARRAAFAEQLGDSEVLALAHHLDDQAETFLLRALRASGPDGLAAMPAWRPFARGHLWRPLLHVPRAALERYAHAHGLLWIDDPSNTDVSFDRNFLRQRVLPLLRERWPRAAASMARSAALCGEASGLLADEDARALRACALAVGAAPTEMIAAPSVATGSAPPPRLGTPAATTRLGPPAAPEATSPSLSRAALIALPSARRARVLRRWIDELGLPPLPAGGIARIESEVLPARGDADAAFEWAGASVRAWRDWLHAERAQPPLPADWEARWDGREPLSLPGGGLLELRVSVEAASAAIGESAVDTRSGHARPPPDAPAFTPPLIVHPRHGGERITLPGRSHSHSLKHVLQESGIPPWERARLPLLSSAEGEVLAAGDRIISAALRDRLDARQFTLVWRRH